MFRNETAVLISSGVAVGIEYAETKLHDLLGDACSSYQ